MSRGAKAGRGENGRFLNTAESVSGTSERPVSGIRHLHLAVYGAEPLVLDAGVAVLVELVEVDLAALADHRVVGADGDRDEIEAEEHLQSRFRTVVVLDCPGTWLPAGLVAVTTCVSVGPGTLMQVVVVVTL